MKKIILLFISLGVILAPDLFAQSTISVEVLKGLPNAMNFQKGQITLNPKGGQAPYTYMWDDLPGSSLTTNTRENLRPGTYFYTVLDVDHVEASGSVELLSYVKWAESENITVNADNSLVKNAPNGWGNAGVSSMNKLNRDQDGYIFYEVQSAQTNLAIGFDRFEKVNLKTVSYESIKYGLLIDSYKLFAVLNGVDLIYLTDVNDRDKLKLEKAGSVIRFIKNDDVLLERPNDDIEYDFRVEAAMFGETDFVFAILSSFFRAELKADVQKGNLIDGYETSGYLAMVPKGGLEPYTYKWNTSSNSSVIDNLPAENYRGVVYDQTGDSAVVKESIGYVAGYHERTNVEITDDGLKKINDDAAAVISLDKYIPTTSSGWIEFPVKNITTDFNVVFREALLDGAFIPPSPTFHEIEIIELTGSQIPTINTAEYNSLNIVDASNYPTRILVAKYKFVSSPGAEAVLSGVHGIAFKDQRLYCLFNGSTIIKGRLLAENDVIRMEKNDVFIHVYVNGILIATGLLNTPVTLGVDVNVLTSAQGIGPYIVSGNLFPLAKQTSICASENPRNWSYNAYYDGLGNIVSETKEYVNVLGQPTQSQYKDQTKNNVIAIQTLYDAFGRTMLKTLPAPTFQTTMCYFENFIKNTSNALYSYQDCDIPNWSSNYYNLTAGERDAPKPVAAGVKGSVGWYYSDNNNEEPYVATAQQPYHRVEYDVTNPADISRSSKAGIGLKHGSGHETFNLTMKASGELYYFLGFMNSWRITDMNTHFNNYSACRSMSDVKTDVMSSMENSVMKKIDVDENGSEAVSFHDAMGNVIGECLSGQVDGANQQIQLVYDYIDVSPGSLYPFIDVHLPDGCQSSIQVEQPSFPYSGTITYDIINLKTGRCDQCGYTGTSPSLGPGYYRIKPVGLPASYPSQLRVRYNTNYYNFKAYYYDKANRLRIVVPPKGIDYAGSGLSGYTMNNGSIAKKFSSTGNGVVYGGSNPNLTNIPQNWELGAGTGLQSMSLNMILPSTYYKVHNFVVKFSGKNTAWSMTFPGENNPTEAYRTVPGESLPSGNLAKMAYQVDEGDKPYEVLRPVRETQMREPVDPFDPMFAVAPTYPNVPPGFNAFTVGGTICSQTVMPVVIQYQIVDQTNGNVPISGVMSVTGYCTITECTGNTVSYSRTWTFPPQNVHQSISSPTASNFVAKLNILNIYAVSNLVANPYGVPWGYYTDITANFSAQTGIKPNSPNHSMTEVYDYNTWDQLLISKRPDAGQTDYVYGPDGKIRATQNSKQNLGEGSNTDKFSYVNYDGNNREFEIGEYDRGLSSMSTNMKFRNYREFAVNSSAPSVILEANNNNNIVDAGRLKEVVRTVYDVPDPNFIIQTALNPAVFQQEHMMGKVSWTYANDKWTWFSYDELGRLKWMVNRYNNVEEATSPYVGVTIKTFWYTYDYLGNITQLDYQYHLPTNTVSDKMRINYSYDADKRLIKTQTTIYGEANPVTKTTAEFSYYLHGPLKRKQLAGNLQGIDYVYTVNGALKSINSPEMDLQHDPGDDGNTGIGKVSYEDLFGMSLDYFNGDYERSGTDVQTYVETAAVVYPNYNGNITAQRWQTKTPGAANLSYGNKQVTYAYEYDKKNQLFHAEFGEITGNHAYTTAGGLGSSPSINYGEDYRLLSTFDPNGNITSVTRHAYWAGAEGLFMDDMTYNYISCTNKLNYVTDAITSAPPNNPNPYYAFGFVAGQSGGNYNYNTFGELVSDNSGNKIYEYNSSGLITVVRNKMTNAKMVEYIYDESNLRICKVSYDPSNPSLITKTLYVRDHEGDVIAVYNKPVSSNLFSVAEWNVYGDDRVGTAFLNNNKVNYVYELDDHVGSVRTTFKEGLKKNFSTSVQMNNSDNCFLKDPYGTIAHFYSSSASCPNATGNKIKGITSVDIPAMPGDVMSANVFASYINTGGNPPIQGIQLVIEIVDASGNIVGGLTNNANVTNVASNSYEYLSTSLTNPAAAPASPQRFFRVYVKNSTTTLCGFDGLNFNLTGNGGYKMPEQLDVFNYYPQGSEMPGMVYHNTINNRYGYQGQFSENDKEINEIFFDLRNYDPLIARFMTRDPYAQFDSPYMAMGNSHPNGFDPDGGNFWSGVVGFVGGAVIGAAVGYGVYAVHDWFDTAPGTRALDLPKENYYTAAAIGGAIGGIAGAVILGTKTNLNWNFGGNDKLGASWTKRNVKFGRDGLWGTKKPRTPSGGRPGGFSKGSRHGFSAGFRIGNIILYDIVIGTPVWKKGSDPAFLSQKPHFHFFKRVPSTNGAYRPLFGPYAYGDGDVGHIYIGGRWLFLECSDDLLTNLRRRVRHR